MVNINFSYSNFSIPNQGIAVILLSTDQVKQEIEKNGLISQFVQNSFNEFQGKMKECSIACSKNNDLDLILLFGIGDEAALTLNKAQELGGYLFSYLNKLKIKKTSIIVNELEQVSDISTAEIIANIEFGMGLKSYRFDKYITKPQKDSSLEEVNIRVESHEQSQQYSDNLKPLYEGIKLTRNLVAEPANILNSNSYAEICKDLTEIGIKVEILGEKELKKLGMNALLSVGQGSVNESKLITMSWHGLDAKESPPIAFVGKGVTFDTGGISLKPSNNMDAMRCDMAGSATVTGVMKTLALRKAKINVVGVIGIVENAISHTAQRPGDIITSMSGKTIEVLNTDAEGRLVLADALWYTQVIFKPKLMIDLATLTGAIIVALSDIYAGLFANDDQLAEQLYNAGMKTGDQLWRLPLSKDFDKMIDSQNADMQNISNRKGAGSITAAQFLQRFVNNHKWAHLDIAGTGMITERELPLSQKGTATGFGVQLLNQFLIDNYES